jgi:peptidoglycan/LPS O-acetylase OafA/YrhL
LSGTPYIRSRYIPGIDGIRAIAILLVLVFHTTPARPLRGGFVGVDVFFVVSGFLITQQLLGRPIDLRIFLARRFARLWPALMGVVLFSLAVTVAGGRPPAALVYSAFYIINVPFAHKIHVGDANLVSHTWSLAIEMQFYVVWALAMIAIRRRGFSTAGLLAITASVSVGSLAVRSLYQVVLSDPTLAYFATEARLDAIFLGATLAVVAERCQPKILTLLARPYLGLLAVAVAAVGFNFATTPGELIASPLAAVGSGALLATVIGKASGFPARRLAGKLAIGIGVRSYSLYLWHWPIFVLFQDHTRLHSSALVIGEWTTALFLAECSYRLVERPFRRRIYRWLDERRQVVPTAGA